MAKATEAKTKAVGAAAKLHDTSVAGNIRVQAAETSRVQLEAHAHSLEDKQL